MEISVRMGETESRLVQEAVERNRTAFSELYNRYVEQVYRHAYYRVSNQADAEDITQETFLRAWKSIDKYKSTGAPFVYWLLTIAGNLAADHYRRRQKTLISDEVDNDDRVGPLSDPVGLAEINLDNRQLKAAVLKLKGDKQKVIIMRFIDGFSYEEIARIFHKSEGAIRVIQYRALADLRHILKQD
jgi:RNA polymerase sigma-70 factor (ECF subfamily)